VCRGVSKNKLKDILIFAQSVTIFLRRCHISLKSAHV